MQLYDPALQWPSQYSNRETCEVWRVQEPSSIPRFYLSGSTEAALSLYAGRIRDCFMLSNGDVLLILGQHIVTVLKRTYPAHCQVNTFSFGVY